MRSSMNDTMAIHFFCAILFCCVILSAAKRLSGASPVILRERRPSRRATRQVRVLRLDPDANPSTSFYFLYHLFSLCHPEQSEGSRAQARVESAPRPVMQSSFIREKTHTCARSDAFHATCLFPPAMGAGAGPCRIDCHE